MRLSDATLNRLPADVVLPRYDRAAIRPGVVHLGLGAFHRAHQAMVFDDAAAAGDHRWGVIGVSMRSADVRDLLAPQDGLYSLSVTDGDARSVRIIGAVREVLVAPEAPTRVIAALAAPDTHIVTLTITEKGYAPGADGQSPPAARLIAAALGARRSAGIAPFTILSCDNLSHNGDKLRELVIAAADDAGLAQWIAEEAAFPNAMVDRIVPATTEADLAAFAAATGIEDRAAIATEPFWQWVIEDRFCGPRPDFAALGVQMTRDVAAWEAAKLRLLNGAHSAMAYLGGLAGLAHVDDVVALPKGRALIEAIWDEAEATLTPPPELDVAAYRAALMQRFANRALGHRLRQIAMDGSQKLPQRLLAPIAERLARGLPAPTLILAVAAWMHWQGGRDDGGASFAVDDPLQARMAAALATARSTEDRVSALLDLEEIFPAVLRDDRAFRDAAVLALAELEDGGARRAIGRVADRR